MTEIEAGFDQPWPIDKVIQEIKRMKTHFPPGEKGKAKYIDTNHQILGLIVEAVTGDPVNIVLNRIFQELRLTQTYVYENGKTENLSPFGIDRQQCTSQIFSTLLKILFPAKDQMTFLKAFFSGYFQKKG